MSKMTFTLTRQLRETMNEAEYRQADARFAHRIRRFRPEPVRFATDAQLAEIVRRARRAARGFGIQDDALVARFVMVDALISPKFYEEPDIIAHFQNAAGAPDIKIGDIFRLIRINMGYAGRADEVWWT